MLLAWPASSGAQDFLEPGFTYELKGEDAALGIVDAFSLPSFVIVRIGNSHVSAINVDTGLERWRFTSKANAIRKIHDRGHTFLIEAEQLYAIDPSTGGERWQLPLNCYSASSCNSRIRVMNDELAVLSGFDGKDDNIMVADIRKGVKLWPNWVAVPGAAHVALTPSTIAVATSEPPYSVVGLDRYTGRERWSFRPEGTEEVASGLLTGSDVVNAWWTSRRADSVYCLSLDSGKPLVDWIVARRASATGELRGGGPGFFFAYQPSVLGGGGRARAWNHRTGDRLWSGTISALEEPWLHNDRLYAWVESKKQRGLVARDARTGTEMWRFERRGVTGYSAEFFDRDVLVRLLGKTPTMAVMDARSGKLKAVGPMESKELGTGLVRYSGRFVFVMNGAKLVRLEPTPGADLLVRFDELVDGGDVEGAEALHAKLRPFVDDLDAAARIHAKVRGRSYQAVSARMKSGGFATLLPAIKKLSGDEHMVFYEDFRGFVTNVSGLIATADRSKAVRGTDLKRTDELMRRVVALIGRFERKMHGADAAPVIVGLYNVVVPLCEILLRSRESEAALFGLHELWRRGWVKRQEMVAPALKKALIARIRTLLPPFERALAKNDGKTMSATLRALLALDGLEVVAPGAPDPESVGAFDATAYKAELNRFRSSLKAP
ncbi:MAG: outer membrane protein assembly factor BamB [Myxococcota bacterium]|jgi:outer membrane protein assembly factor BamB